MAGLLSMQIDNIRKGRLSSMLSRTKQMQRIAGIANLSCPVPGLSTLANAYQIDMPLYRKDCGASSGKPMLFSTPFLRKSL